jgi:hypothetical protein
MRHPSAEVKSRSDCGMKPRAVELGAKQKRITVTHLLMDEIE